MNQPVAAASDTKPYFHDAAKIAAAIGSVNKWLSTRASSRRESGVVVVLDGIPWRWFRELPPARQWQWNSMAIGHDGALHEWTCQGEESGTESWIPIPSDWATAR